MTTENTDKMTPAEIAKESAVTGWKMQRKLVARERAEQAQRADAVATGRKIRGGTYRVVMPADLSINPSSQMAETLDIDYVEAPGTGALCEVQNITLPRNVMTDPRNVWEASRLMAACNYAAASTNVRGISADDRADIAALVVADIMARTHGGMPLRTDITADDIGGAARHKALDIIAARDAETPDGDIGSGELETVAQATAQAISGAEMQRAQRDQDRMTCEPIGDAYDRPIPGTGPMADPMPATCAEMLADLTGGERDALRVALGERAADIARATDRDPSAVRMSVKRGRAKLATRDDLAEMIASASGPETDAERSVRIAASALRFLRNAEPTGERPIVPAPDRYPARDADAEPSPWEVPHAPVTISDVSTRGDLLAEALTDAD